MIIHLSEYNNDNSNYDNGTNSEYKIHNVYDLYLIFSDTLQGRINDYSDYAIDGSVVR